MKRIKESESSENFVSLKPLFGSKGNPPYYDPNDLHVHVWKRGKLPVEDDPKVKTYSKSKLTIKDCVYCKICHIVKDSFQSTVSENRDIVTDILCFPIDKSYSEYTIMENVPNKEKIVVDIKSIPENKPICMIGPNNRKLFHSEEGIFDNYVTIEIEQKSSKD
jgi:hypothetical protein